MHFAREGVRVNALCPGFVYTNLTKALTDKPESRKFLGFYLNDGVVRAAVGLNRGGDPDDPKEDGELKAVASLIRNRVPVDPARLANEDVDLRGLARPGTH